MKNIKEHKIYFILTYNILERFIACTIKVIIYL